MKIYIFLEYLYNVINNIFYANCKKYCALAGDFVNMVTTTRWTMLYSSHNMKTGLLIVENLQKTTFWVVQIQIVHMQIPNLLQQITNVFIQ